MSETEQLKKEIEDLKFTINQIVKSDRYLFQRNLDLLNVSIGMSDKSKFSFHGVTPVVQASAIASPSANVGELKTAVDAIITALKNKGLTA